MNRKNSKSTFTQVSFEVTAATKYGEQIKVMGSSPRLGQFNHLKALPLVTTPETYPLWRGIHPIMVPSNVTVSYSYLILSGGVAEPSEDRQQIEFRSFRPKGKTYLVRDTLSRDLSNDLDDDDQKRETSSGQLKNIGPGASSPDKSADSSRAKNNHVIMANMQFDGRKMRDDHSYGDMHCPTAVKHVSQDTTVDGAGDKGRGSAQDHGTLREDITNGSTTEKVPLKAKAKAPSKAKANAPSKAKAKATPSKAKTKAKVAEAEAKSNLRTSCAETDDTPGESASDMVQIRAAAPRQKLKQELDIPKNHHDSNFESYTEHSSSSREPICGEKKDAMMQDQTVVKTETRVSTHNKIQGDKATDGGSNPLNFVATNKSAPPRNVLSSSSSTGQTKYHVSSAASSNYQGVKAKLEHSSLYIVCKHLPIIVRCKQRTPTKQVPTSSSSRSSAEQEVNGVIAGDSSKGSWVTGTDGGVDAFAAAYSSSYGAHPDNQWVWTVEWHHNMLSRQRAKSVAPAGKTKWVGMIPSHRILNEDGLPFCDADGGALDGILRLQINDAVIAHGCVPLWPDINEWQQFESYCDHFLWPLFHNVQELTDGETSMRWEVRNDADLWTAYTNINRLVARRLCALFTPRDIIWIHDFHFLLTPRLVRNTLHRIYRNIDPGMILYFNSPFPTSEIIRALGRRDEILFGIVSASLLVFNVYNYARHFVNTCKRILGLKTRSLDGGMLALETPDSRSLGLSIVSPSPDVTHLEQIAQANDILSAAKQLRAAYGGRKVIVGMDRCSRLNGVTLKLLAYEKLLTDCPRLVPKVVLVQRCTIGSGADGERSAREILELVNRISNRFGPAVIDYCYNQSELDIAEQLKLWLQADVLLHTPVMENYNLSVLEFIWTIRLRRPSPPLIIISEFSGVTPSLNGVYEVNPFNIIHVSSALDQALNLSVFERLRRASRLLGSRALLSTSTQRWLSHILADLLVVWKGYEPSGTHPPQRRTLDGGPIQDRHGDLHMLESKSPCKSDNDEVIWMKSVGIQSRPGTPHKEGDPSYPSSYSSVSSPCFPSFMSDWNHYSSMTLPPFVIGASSTAVKKEMVDLEALTNNGQSLKENEGTLLESHSVSSDSSFRKASVSRIRTSYHRCKKRLFLLAYGGSLVDQEPSDKAIKHDFFGAEGRKPKSAMKTTLMRLAQDPANAVFVVSDMADQRITALLRGIPNLGFVINNGLKVVWPTNWPIPDSYSPADAPIGITSAIGSSNTASSVGSSNWWRRTPQWTTFSYDDVKAEWLDMRHDIVKTMSPFKVVNGSRLVTDNEVKVEWDFSRADPEWGALQADCLVKELQKRFSTHSNLIQVNHIQGRAVEVRMGVLSLRSFVREMVMPHFSSGFVLATASTSSDEDMFVGLYEAISAKASDHQDRNGMANSAECELHTITIGKKASQAHLYVDGSQGLLRILSKLHK